VKPALRLATGIIVAGVSLSLLLSGTALAESDPRSVRTDPRIRTVPFQKDNVVQVLGMMGVATMIEFNADERIATVSMGDTVAWQAVPDQTHEFLFIKPLRANAVTNLNVVTTKRVYTFMLHGDPPGNTRRAVIKLRFNYPEEVTDARLLPKAEAMAANPNLTAAQSDPSKLNYDYGYKGSLENKPTAVFDDGVKTFFQFQKGQDSPGIFLVKADNSETLVNYHREGDFVVVDRVNKQWTLRNGTVTTCVFNQKSIASGE
jgi:type IV secretion system protein VirB9